MDLEDLKKKKLDDLRYIGKMLGIKSMTRMSKPELIEAILNGENQERSDAKDETEIKSEKKHTKRRSSKKDLHVPDEAETPVEKSEDIKSEETTDTERTPETDQSTNKSPEKPDKNRNLG